MHHSFHRPLRLLLGVLIALSLSVTTAQAYTISPGGAITATSNGKLTMRSALFTSQCDWSLIGSITNTSPAAGDTIGSFTSTSVTNCLGGIRITDLIATRGAYALRLNSVLGSPVTGALLMITNWTFAYSSPPCLFSGNVGTLLNEATSVISLLSNTLSSSCGTLSFSGSFTLSPAQSIT